MIKINNLLQIDEDLSSLLKFVYLRGARTAIGNVAFTARNIHIRRVRASITGAAGIQFIPSSFELDPGQVRTVLLNVSDVAFLETLPVGTTSVDFKIAVNEILPSVTLLPEPVVPGILPPPTIILGCLDPNAPNFNSSANVSDGSCQYLPGLPPTIRGCTTRGASNFNPYATEDDGSCITPDDIRPPAVYGCTDRNATNFNPLATVNTGCTYRPKISGCTNPRALNYNIAAEIEDGSCVNPGRWVLLQTAPAYETTRKVLTQRSEENFQEATAANNFVRGYYYTEYGYTETTYYGIAYEYQLEGDAQAAGRRPAAPVRDISTERGAVEIIVNRFLRPPDVLFVVCNEVGNVTSRTVYPPGTDKFGYIRTCRLVQAQNETGGCTESCADEFVGVYGCTNPTATNFNRNATIDDNSCVLPVEYCNTIADTTGCSEVLGSGWAGTATRTVNVLVNGQVTPTGCTSLPDVPSQWNTNGCVRFTRPISGCTDARAINYNSSATLDDGTCQYRIDSPPPLIFGCTDPNATNYNSRANRDDGSCVARRREIFGCTNTFAVNYNPQATRDDGSCQSAVQGGGDIFGCTDPSAINYNPRATRNDGSCQANRGSGGGGGGDTVGGNDQSVALI